MVVLLARDLVLYWKSLLRDCGRGKLVVMPFSGRLFYR
jgi:hypothetical protein